MSEYKVSTEEKRHGILTKYNGYCIFCGKPTVAYHHFLFGRRIREIAESDGIKGPACDDCHMLNSVQERIHDNPMAEKLSKICGQLAWEKRCVALGHTEDEARKFFQDRYGRSWL